MFVATLEKTCAPRILRKFQQIRRQCRFHGKSPLLKRGRNRLRLHLSACIQAGRYSKVEYFGIDVTDAAIGLRNHCH